MHPGDLRLELDGNIYIGESNVLLSAVLNWLGQGMTPEWVADNYPTIALADVVTVRMREAECNRVWKVVEEIFGHEEMLQAVLDRQSADGQRPGQA